jgi:hypothetical protein
LNQCISQFFKNLHKYNAQRKSFLVFSLLSKVDLCTITICFLLDFFQLFLKKVNKINEKLDQLDQLDQSNTTA